MSAWKADDKAGVMFHRILNTPRNQIPKQILQLDHLPRGGAIFVTQQRIVRTVNATCSFKWAILKNCAQVESIEVIAVSRKQHPGNFHFPMDGWLRLCGRFDYVRNFAGL